MLSTDSTQTGIYAIHCLANGRKYIGSTTRREGFRKRLSCHLRDLRQNKHHSQQFQRCWNKYGEEAFEFEIVEIVQPLACENFDSVSFRQRVLQREQDWLDSLTGQLLNCSPSAGSVKNLKLTEEQCARKRGQNHHQWGKPHSSLTKAKISATKKNSAHPWRGKNLPASIVEKIRESKRGFLNPQWHKPKSPETIAKIRSSTIRSKAENNRPALLVSPCGDKYVTDSVSSFAQQFQLTQTNLSKVLVGKRSHHQGWTGSYATSWNEVPLDFTPVLWSSHPGFETTELIMLKIAIFNFKGGTGKSTTVINLGACLALVKGKAEPIATSVKNLCLIPGDLDLFDLEADTDLFTPALAKLTGFDVCLMDCSPGLGVASVQAILTSDRILIPVIGEPAVLKGLSEAVQLIRLERPDVPIDVVRVRYRPRLTIAKEADELLAEAASELDYRLLKTTVPENIAVAEAIAHAAPVTVYSSRSSGAKAYKALASECVEVWK